MAQRGVFLRLGATGAKGVGRALKNVDKRLTGIGRTSKKTSSEMRRSFAGMKSSARGLFALLAGGGIVAGTKKIISYQKRLGELQGKMRASTADMVKLDNEIRAVSTSLNLNKDAGLEAIEVYQDLGGHTEAAMRTFAEMSRIAKATGAEQKNLAQVQGRLFEQGFTGAETIKALRILSEQADAGTIAMNGLDKEIGALVGTASKMGKAFEGVEGVAKVGRLVQLAGGFAKGPEDARTAVLALFRDLSKSAAKLGKGKDKINVFDETGMRDTETLMAQILKRTKGKVEGKNGLSSIFTEESQKLALAFKGAFDFDTGKFKAGSSIGRTRKATGTRAGTERQLALVRGGISKEAEDLEGALRKLGNAVDVAATDIFKRIVKSPAAAAGLAVAGIAAAKIGPKILGGLLGFITKARGGAGAAPGVGGAGGVTPVFVVNLPGANAFQAAGFGLGPGGAGAGGAGAKKGFGGLLTATSKTGKALQATGIIGMFAGVATAGFQFGSMLDNLLGLSDKVSDALVGFNKRAADERVKKFTKQIGEGAVVSQARELAQLAKSGVKTVETRGGEKVALNEENIRKILATQGAAQGLSPEAMKALGGAITDALKGAIVIKPAGGVDKVEVEIGRGPAR